MHFATLVSLATIAISNALALPLYARSSIALPTYNIRVYTAQGSYYLTPTGTLANDHFDVPSPMPAGSSIIPIPDGPPAAAPGEFIFDAVSVAHAGDDMLVRLFAGEGVCRVVGENAILLCGTPEVSIPEISQEPEAVLRAIHRDDDAPGKYELLGGFKNWSVDLVEGASEQSISVKDVYAGKVLKVMLEQSPSPIMGEVPNSGDMAIGF